MIDTTPPTRVGDAARPLGIDTHIDLNYHLTVRMLMMIVTLLVGLSAGYLSAGDLRWSARAGMALLGLLIAFPIALAVFGSRRGASRHGGLRHRVERGTDDVDAALAENYWRDRGHPPFMKPPDALPDKHQFDPDKLN